MCEQIFWTSANLRQAYLGSKTLTLSIVTKEHGSHPKAPPYWSRRAPGFLLQLPRSVFSRVCIAGEYQPQLATGRPLASVRSQQQSWPTQRPTQTCTAYISRYGILRCRLSQRKAWVRLLIGWSRGFRDLSKVMVWMCWPPNYARRRQPRPKYYNRHSGKCRQY